MFLNKFLVLLLLASACTSGHRIQTANHTVDQTHQGIQYSIPTRDFASSGTGMDYPAEASFKMNDFRGTTFVTFLKENLKPALDKLSDTKNGGGGGFDNIGADAYIKNSRSLDATVLKKYRGAKWNRTSRSHEGGLTDGQVENVYTSLKAVKPKSTVDSLTYFNKEDKAWPTKNDMAIALKEAHINAAPFDLATLYALTGGIGAKVKIDDNNYNYHALYMTGKTNPHVEVMSGRSFASSPGRNVGDATDPEYLRDLSKYLKETEDQKSFYHAMILALASSDSSEWSQLSNQGQLVLSDFLTVYTAESVRHLMVNLKHGSHPWEIDLAAVTFVSAVSAKLDQVVTGGVLVNGDLGGWFAPSPNNVAGGPQRSGIGITRKDRIKFQKVIHSYEMTTPDGKELIDKIQLIIGKTENSNDVIQGVFEFLSNPSTPRKLGAGAMVLADHMAKLAEISRDDAQEIAKSFK
jgi:hypothetical protein